MGPLLVRHSTLCQGGTDERKQHYHADEQEFRNRDKVTEIRHAEIPVRVGELMVVRGLGNRVERQHGSDTDREQGGQ